MRAIRLLIPITLLTATTVCGRSATMTPVVVASPSRTNSATANPANSVGDTLGPIRQRAVAAVLQRIAGRENAPAESVFQNVKVLRGIPARSLLEIMNNGFGHGLGVSCGFCHVPGQWASDERPNKNIARDMLGMVNRVNTDLHGMRNLPDSNPTIGCITCHRMAPKPMLVAMPR
jgi:hypothetical protein